MTNIKIDDLKTDLFEELNGVDLSVVVGGATGFFRVGGFRGGFGGGGNG